VSEAYGPADAELARMMRAALESATQFGCFIKLRGFETIDIAASVFDFGVLDLEHSQLGERDALDAVAYARALRFPVIVRVSNVEPDVINRVLEAGAAGVQLSNVCAARDVTALRDACLYPPGGQRSVSLAQASAGYGRVPLVEYLSAHRDGPLIVVQIESAETEDPLNAILQVGVDVAFVGTTDIAVAVGLDEVAARARVEDIVATVAREGVVAGAFNLPDERVRYRIDTSDVALLALAARQHAGGVGVRRDRLG